MKSSHGPLLAALVAAVMSVIPSLCRAIAPGSGPDPLVESGVKGGFIVHLGCGDGGLLESLKRASTQVQGLDRDAGNVEAVRSCLVAKGVYGDICTELLRGDTLPYIDGVVNLLVVEDGQGIQNDEIQRVLVPNGVAMIRKGNAWEKVIKARTAAIDDWTHYFYDSRGNAVSKDTTVAPPERLQWVGSPRWSRHHDRMSSVSAQVSANGRMFYIMDEGSRISILLPSHWVITARDAFNGVVLWKKDIAQWNPHMWPLKSGPTQLTRRLVAVGDRVYVTLGIEAPVTCLDAATGAVIREFPETKGAEEMILSDGVLYVLANPKPWVLENYAPAQNTGDQKRVETEFNWDKQPRTLMAVDATSGQVLWKKESTLVAPLTIAADGKALVYHDGDKLVCTEAKTGAVRWEGASAGKRNLYEFNYGPRVVLHEKVLLYAGGDGAMKGVDLQSGKDLWTSSHEKSGYRSPEDLLVANGLVWNAGTLSGNQTGEFKGRDPVTGEIKVQFMPDVETYWFHHRCYIAKGTEKFLLPSRTGIEFVDLEKKHWDINHWVRGACLYGIMPCNGLVYAGPHNCACYPEAKLDGINALAPALSKPLPKPRPAAEGLERGPAYGQAVEEREADARDWPTYRHDRERSGYTDQELLENLDVAWQADLGGRLSASTIAAGTVWVSQVDKHTLHALDAATGKPKWHFVAGGRVDSPPTYWKGRILFGSKDGRVYCLRASDGALLWRFDAAPWDRRHFAFEQLESVWPVHGSVLVEDGVVSFVAGRSVFLDSGLYFYRLNVATGDVLASENYNELDPETGRDLQERVKTLQMPVGLNDILSSDGHHTFLRSQKIGADGKRVEIGPISGDAAGQGGEQKGEGRHLFAPMGYLDDSWFHRSYWVFGKNFAGGHNGYYQAGKYTPSGRILVFDDERVFGYGREPKYLKWTTTMEHQLFAASRGAPDAPTPALPPKGPKGKAKANAKGKNAQAAPADNTLIVNYPASPKIDPSNKAISVEVWVLPDGGEGVIVNHGGPLNGYALALIGGKPLFAVNAGQKHVEVVAKDALGDGWHHLVGVLAGGKIQLYVDGALAVSDTAPDAIPSAPKNGLRLGNTGGSVVSKTATDVQYRGMLDQFTLWHRALTADEIATRAVSGSTKTTDKAVVLASSFDNGDARDDSGHELHGVDTGVETGKGKSGAALWFRKIANPIAGGKGGKAAGGGKGPETFVKFDWNRYVPVYARAMAMAGDQLFIAGPPDIVNEEYAFERMTKRDPAILDELAQQDAALRGEQGARLQGVSTGDGEVKHALDLKSPPIWDGMAIAQGCLFVSSEDGKITRYGKAP